MPHGTCIQTGVPAQGGLQSKQDTTHAHIHTHAGHRRREWGIFKGHGWPGEPWAGAHSVFKHRPSVVFVGEGVESRTWPRTAFGKAVASRRDLREEEHTRGQGSQAQGETGKSLGEGMDTGRANKVKAGKPGKKSRRSPGAPREELLRLPGCEGSCFRAQLSREILNRSSGKACSSGYLPDLRAPSNLWDRDQKPKEENHLLTGH